MGNATKVMASTIGVICGLSGLEHGFFEVMQGNVPTVFHIVSGKPMIYAIGDAIRFWAYGYEYAYTIVHNYLITGILAMVVSLLVIIWSAGFIQKKAGWLVFIVLSVAQYLVGGGAAQFGPAMLAGVVAIAINHPIKWRRPFLPAGLLGAIARPWEGLLAVFALVFCHSIVTAVFGFFYGVRDPDVINQIMWGALDIMIGLFPLVIISSLAHDSIEAFDWNKGAIK